MTTRVTRSERILNRLVSEEKLTPQGRDWLIAALDPMHDTQLSNLRGWPDLADQPSIVRCVKKSLTIAKEAGLGAGNWNMVIQTLPILNSRQTVQCDHVNNNFTGESGSGSVANTGALVYGQCLTTQSDWSLAGGHFGDSAATNVIALPDEYAVGNGRLVGMGFEVNNTTAEIYKQGTVHVYRSPQQQETYPTYTWRRETTVRDSAGTGTTKVITNDAITGRQVLFWPSSEEALTLLPGTRTWKASDGCYCVVPFESEENPITPCEYVSPILVDQFIGTPIRGNTAEKDSVTYTTSPFSNEYEAGVYAYGLQWANKWAPVHSCGAAFTGLSDQTSLTLTVNMYYEYFPSAADTALVTLATPSACFDPFALALYSEALSSLPVGVPAYMNGFGDWFAGIVSKLAPGIGAALTPIFGPASAAIGIGAKGIADSYLASQSPQNRPTMKKKKGPSGPPRLPKKDYVVVLPPKNARKKRNRKKKVVRK